MRAWCGTCRRTQPVVETDTQHQLTASGEVAWHVQHLDCGHSNATRQGVVAPAPGAPYAGPIGTAGPPW